MHSTTQPINAACVAISTDHFHWAGFDFSLCGSQSQAYLCSELSHKAMLSPDYGLQDIRYLDADLLDFSRYTFFAGRRPQAVDQILATIRLDFAYDLGRFRQNLEPAVMRLWEQGRVADGSVYYKDRKNSLTGVVLFQGLLALSIATCRARGVDAIYVQIRHDHLEKFKRLGFALVGEPFLCEGWNGRWFPMLLWVGRGARSPHLKSNPDASLDANPAANRYSTFWPTVSMLLRDHFSEGPVDPAA